jgi:hypothetical protein
MELGKGVWERGIRPSVLREPRRGNTRQRQARDPFVFETQNKTRHHKTTAQHKQKIVFVWTQRQDNTRQSKRSFLCCVALPCLVLSCHVVSCVLLCTLVLPCLILCVLCCVVMCCVVLSSLVFAFLGSSCFVLLCLERVRPIKKLCPERIVKPNPKCGNYT